MAARKLKKVYDYTPVRPANGGQTHATSLDEVTRTACGKYVCSGWVVARDRLDCEDCKARTIVPTRRRRRARA